MTTKEGNWVKPKKKKKHKVSTNGMGELLFEGSPTFRRYKKGPPNNLGDWKVMPSNPRKNIIEL